jgi:hypothetical protein
MFYELTSLAFLIPPLPAPYPFPPPDLSDSSIIFLI